jgi:DNA-binding response OmpR family regulator
MPETILSIRATQAMAEATRLLLEEQGFRVVSATDFRQVEAACAQGQFELVLIGDAIEPRTKKAIAALIRDRCSVTVPILEIYTSKPELDNVHSVSASDPPAELIQTLKTILNQQHTGQSA